MNVIGEPIDERGDISKRPDFIMHFCFEMSVGELL
jgi:hypothetical protein